MVLTQTATIKRIGYICLRPKFPKVLFNNWSAWVFPELPPLEAVTVLEVITINRKKKVWDYTYDESDSDNEAAPRAGAGGYTTHRLCLCNPRVSASTLSDTAGDCSDPDSEEAMLSEPEDESEPEAKPQSLAAPGPAPGQSEYTGGAHDGRGAQLADPLSGEDGSSTGGSEDRIFFNVDLNSVFVRVLDDDNSNSEAPPVLCLPEDSVSPEDPEPEETGLLVPSGTGTQLPFPGPPVESVWPEDDPSDKSDTSESDVDIGDGYIMR